MRVLARRDAAPRSELLTEYGGAAVADAICDLLDGHAGGFQQFLGEAEPLAEQPGGRCPGGGIIW